jgi:UPF0755 protein
MARSTGLSNFYSPVRVGIILFLLGSIWIGSQTYVDHFLAPVSANTNNTRSCVVNIKKGAPLREIGDTLQREELISSVPFFIFYARVTGAERQIKAGSYKLSNDLTLKEILERIVGGDVLRYRVTIPEGYTTEQIGDLLVSKGIVTSSGFKDALESDSFAYPFLEDAPEGPKRLDGFLFPATYDLRADFTPEEILELMLKRFDSAITPDLQAQEQKQELSPRQVITLASIVEREAKLDAERPVIASVFLNRLQQGMRLESCATVQYILGTPKEILTYEDLKIQSPYNTYLHEGLPPGPISNPGLASIRAVLYPAETDYLYFVARGDGSHVFTATLAEHETASRQNGR